MPLATSHEREPGLEHLLILEQRNNKSIWFFSLSHVLFNFSLLIVRDSQITNWKKCEVSGKLLYSHFVGDTEENSEIPKYNKCTDRGLK